MSLAEEMLATMPLSDDSSTVLEDEEGHIVINESRQAIVPNELKIIAVTGDKDIETVTFDCVRYWDGHDLSTFAIYLNYVLPDMSTGTYIPKSIVAENDVFHFDWEIKNNITEKSGGIVFAVTAVKTKTNEEGQTVVDKQWSSLPNRDCSIALGLNIANVPDTEETQDILAQMSAILEQIHANVDEWIKTALVQETGHSEEKAMSQKATTIAIEDAKSYSRSYTDDRYAELNADIQKNYQIAIRNSKQIENLKSGISERFELDSSVSYAKDVPANALPYAEIANVGGMTYKDGDTLRSAPVTAVKSVGVNLTTAQAVYEGASSYAEMVVDGRNCVRFTSGVTTKKTPIAFKPNAQYSVSFYAKSENYGGADTGNHGFTFFYSDGTSSRISIWQNATTWQLYTLTSESGKTVTHIGVASSEYRAYVYLDTDTFMFNEGSTALPYTPYVEHTLPIPTAVQALDGYGEGVNESVYNYIDWEKKQFVKCVGVVDIGSLYWTYNGTDIFHTTIAGRKKGLSNFLCEKYQNANSEFSYMADDTITGNSELNFIYVKDSTYTDAATFKAAMAGVMLYYELATPVVTDISDIITADNLIGVEGNGTITFENEYGYAVPSVVEYQLEV